MAQQGDRYVVELKEPHLQWGEYRYTDTRETKDIFQFRLMMHGD